MEYDAYDPTLPSRREDAPEDHKNVAYWSCVALGAGILFPWNAWITAVDYFEMTYPGRHVDRVFPVLYFFPNVCALLVAALSFPATKTGETLVEAAADSAPRPGGASMRAAAKGASLRRS